MGIITCYYFYYTLYLCFQVGLDTSKYPGGTHIGKWYGMCRGHDPFFSGQSALAKFTINVSLMCPPPTI